MLLTHANVVAVVAGVEHYFSGKFGPGDSAVPKEPKPIVCSRKCLQEAKGRVLLVPALEDVYLAYLPLAHIFEMAAQAIEMLSWAWQLICLSE